MKNSLKILKNSSGQMVVESVLIIALLLGFATVIAREFKDDEVISKLVQGPWLALSGMIQNGVWVEPKKSMLLHPNHMHRHISREGSDPE